MAGFTGGGAGNSANIFITLKPRSERPSAEEVIDRLRPKLQTISGASLYLQPQQDIRVGGRGGNSLYQYTLVSDEVGEVTAWAPKLLAELKQSPVLTDPNSDQQIGGRQTYLTFDRDTAARLGITAKQIDNTLYGAYGQALVSTMYADNNQYHVVMEVAPQYAGEPETLRDLYVRSPGGQMVPLSSFARYETSVAPLAIRHQGPFPSVTLSFGVTRGKSLGDAVKVLENAKAKIGFPATIRAGFAGTAQAFQSSLKDEPILILASLGVIYIVLGMLYENTFHPLTILSTLPSAGVGACLALWVTHTELSLIAIIGVILLIGIVKKNAILMIDFAITAERDHGRSPREAIEEACHLRFRPILMTTMAAMLGAVPLACAAGIGSELRRPLGIAIIGGLALSQLLTLYTTPVVYLALDRLRLSWRRRLGLSLKPAEAAA
ncbi:MAG: efflux RND transporter permease subunit [Verrucomicrobium sp.]|nr:efflux RND transporter permease subunit [Verrucomicrobium sp.]